MFVLITYDVVENRTDVFRRMLSRFLTHEQNSVFSGRIGEADLRSLRQEISDASREGDRYFVITAKNAHNVSCERLQRGPRGGLVETESIDSTAKSVVL